MHFLPPETSGTQLAVDEDPQTLAISFPLEEEGATLKSSATSFLKLSHLPCKWNP